MTLEIFDAQTPRMGGIKEWETATHAISCDLKMLHSAFNPLAVSNP